MKPFEKYVKIEEERYLTLLEKEERLLKGIEYIEELYKMVKEQDSDNVNLIDRLEIVLNILKGE